MNDNLSELIKRGGVFYKLPSIGKKEVLSDLIYLISAEVLSVDKRDILLKAVMERETLISTGIENGIALPHPRTPLLNEGELPFVAIAFPQQSIDWGTPDNKQVHTVFLIVSESPKQHLDALTKINFMCMDEVFYKLVASQADKEKIIAAIEKAEKNWQK